MTTHQPPSESRFFQLDLEFHLRALAVIRTPDPGTVCAIDATGSLLRLESAQTCESLEFMAAAGGKLRLITLESDFILQRCSRFLQTRDRLGPSIIKWCVAREDQARHVQQTSVVGKSGMVKKPVRTAPHGFGSEEPGDLAGQMDYFEQLWTYCESASPSRPLGI